MNQNYGYMAMSLIQKHIPFTVPYVIIACISNIHLKHVSENIDPTGDLCSNVTLCNLLKGPSKLKTWPWVLTCISCGDVVNKLPTHTRTDFPTSFDTLVDLYHFGHSPVTKWRKDSSTAYKWRAWFKSLKFEHVKEVFVPSRESSSKSLK